MCYDDDDRLQIEMRKDFPVGEICPECDSPILEGENGQAMPYSDGIDGGTVRHVHKECLLRMAVGPLAHLEQRCHHYSGVDNRTVNMTRREEAKAVWKWFHDNGGILPRLMDVRGGGQNSPVLRCRHAPRPRGCSAPRTHTKLRGRPETYHKNS